MKDTLFIIEVNVLLVKYKLLIDFQKLIVTPEMLIAESKCFPIKDNITKPSMTWSEINPKNQKRPLCPPTEKHSTSKQSKILIPNKLILNLAKNGLPIL